MLLCTQWRQPPKKCAKGKHTHPSPVIAGGQQPNVQGVDRKEERLRVEAEVPRHPAMRRLAMPRMSLWQHQLPTPNPPLETPTPPPSSATHRCPAPCGLILVHLHPNPRWQLPRTHPSAHPICLEVAQPAVTCISQTFWLSTCALAVTFPSICIDMETHDIVAKIRNGRPQAVKCMQAPKNVQRREDKI